MLIGGDMFRLWGAGTDDGPIDQVRYVLNGRCCCKRELTRHLYAD